MVEKITVQDARRAGYCVSGIRKWAQSHDLDFRTLVKHGLTEEEIRATGDEAMVERVIAVRDGGENG